MMRHARGQRMVGHQGRVRLRPSTAHPAPSAQQLPRSRCCSGSGTVEVWTTVDIQHPRFQVQQWQEQVLVKEASTPAAAPQADVQLLDGAAEPGPAAAAGLPSDVPRPTSVLQKLQHQAFVRKTGRMTPAAAVAMPEAPPKHTVEAEHAAGRAPAADLPAAADPLPSAPVAQAGQQAQQEAVVGAAAKSRQLQQRQAAAAPKQKAAMPAAAKQRQPRLPVARLLQPLANPTPLGLQVPSRQDISSTAAVVCEHMHKGRSVLLTAGESSAVSKVLYVAAAARVLQQARHGGSLVLQPSWMGGPPPAHGPSTHHTTTSSEQQQQQQQEAAAGLHLQVRPAAEHLLRYRAGTTLFATRQPGSWGCLVAPLAAQLAAGGSATLRAAGAGALHNALAAAAAVRQRLQAQGADLALVPRYQVMSRAEWKAGSRAGRAAAAAQLVREGEVGPVSDGEEEDEEPFSAMLLQVVLVAPLQQQRRQQRQQQQQRARKPGKRKHRHQVQEAKAGQTAAATTAVLLDAPLQSAVAQRELVMAAA